LRAMMGRVVAHHEQCGGDGETTCGHGGLPTGLAHLAAQPRGAPRFAPSKRCVQSDACKVIRPCA
jgi:hypothetical protein